MELTHDHGRVLAVKELDDLFVVIVRLQLGRHRDLPNAAAEGGESAVAHLMGHAHHS